jgi:hypothetical protein
LEARAASSPGFTRFTSPDLHVCAFSSTAILFKVSYEDMRTASQLPGCAANASERCSASTSAKYNAKLSISGYSVFR